MSIVEKALQKAQAKPDRTAAERAAADGAAVPPHETPAAAPLAHDGIDVVATATSPLIAFCSAGSGVFALRGASVLPPPSRLTCARMSALVGFETDFALTSATSSAGALSCSLPRSNGWKRIARSTTCSTIEAPSA